MSGRFLLPSLLFSLLIWPAVRSAGPNQGDQRPRKDRHALLVGVSFYENLPKNKHLIGPANDVLLMRQLLLDKFQFSPDRIVVLSEQEGKERGKNAYPSRANIEREFKRLAAVVQPGDQVVIHLGGHGSQQPEDKTSPDPEPDGLDEIFLPRDVGAWNASKGTVANAIIDDELGAWLKAIRDRKASVWITFDACHSATMIRGGDAREVARDLDPVGDLGVPKEAIKEAVAFAAKRDAGNIERARGGETPPPFKLAAEGGLVAIYACQPNEVTYERELPAQCKDGKIHGLLTYALCKVLTEATEKGRAPITYNELARRIQAQYVQWGRTSPTPVIEGIDRDRQVLGDKVWPGRSSIVLGADADGYTINAGALQGLTEGSILAVMSPPDEGDQLLGHVRVKELRTSSAGVEPCAFGKTSVAKTLPAGGACKTVYVDMGDQQLRVAVDPLDAGDKPVPPAVRAELEKSLKGLFGPESLLRPAEQAAQADWLVRLQGEQVILVPGSGWSSAARAPNGLEGFGPRPIDADLAAWLKAGLTQIARADSLKRLAARADAGAGDQAVRLELKLWRRKDAADKIGSFPIAWPAPDIVSYDGDRVVVKITNKGKVPVDVTVLYVDSGFGIDCLYPSEGGFNRLRPGESQPVFFGFNSKTAGAEQVVVIGLRGNDQPIELSALAQPTLAAVANKAKTRGDNLDRALDSPLGKLLKRGMYGEGGTRGRTTEDLNDYTMLMVPFTVRPEKRGGSK